MYHITPLPCELVAVILHSLRIHIQSTLNEPRDNNVVIHVSRKYQRLTTYDLPGYNPGNQPYKSCVEDIYIRMFWGDDVALRTYSHYSS